MQQELSVWNSFSIQVGENFFLNVFVLLPYLLCSSPFLLDYSVIKASMWPCVTFKYDTLNIFYLE